MKVTVNSSSPYRVAINNQQPKSIRTVGIQPNLYSRLANLLDVDATDLNNNETIVYDAVSEKYVVKTLPVLDGGTF
jgi:hypothetical protein